MSSQLLSPNCSPSHENEFEPDDHASCSTCSSSRQSDMDESQTVPDITNGIDIDACRSDSRNAAIGERNENYFRQLMDILDSEKARLREVQGIPTYADPANRVLGCPHYERACKLYAKCCSMYITCRLCHDAIFAASSHELDRFEVSKVLCMECGTEQEVGPRCINPKCPIDKFANYYCDVCHFYDDTGTDVFYHCKHCGECQRK